ncbi:ABC transporter substrate-binding protein [Lacrimispora sp. AGF001]|uniref:ABC transporter substrate-binding protein n=1 Tax=Lacrimispora sp. AGF001 TaxID=3401631 RepID=UPI003B4362E3
MKKIISIVTIAALSLSMLSGCQSISEKTTADAKDSTDMTEIAVESVNESGIAYPYEYTDAAGRTIVIEKEPQAVVTNYLPLWETLILLGVKPIAVSGADNYIKTWDAFQGYDVSGVKDLGASELNLELLAQLKPDMILNQSYDMKNLEIGNLEKIGPVAVFGNDTKMDWRLSLREVAKIVNKQDKAEEVIKDMDEKLEADREKLAEKYKDQTVVQFSLMGKDKYYVAYRPDLYDKEKGLGLNVPEGFTQSETYEQISMEALVKMNPDYIFVNVFDGDEPLLEELENNSVWKSLKAVKNEHIYQIDGSGHAASPLATLYTVNFITDKLTAD